MKLERRSLSRLALPLKALVDRFAFATLVVALDRAAGPRQGRRPACSSAVGSRIGDASRRCWSALIQPIDAVAPAGRAASASWSRCATRTRACASRTAACSTGRARRRQLALENAALRQMLNCRGRRRAADRGHRRAWSPMPAGRSCTPCCSTPAPTRASPGGMAAVNERGLVGRVIEVGRRSARVLLLTDFNSRIPVMVEPSRDQAILAGDNTPRAGAVLPAAQPAPVGRRPGGHLGPRRRAAAGARGRRGQRDRRRQGRGRRRWSTGTAWTICACSSTPRCCRRSSSRSCSRRSTARRCRPATCRRRLRPRRPPPAARRSAERGDLAAPARRPAARAGAVRDRAARRADRRPAAARHRARSA